MTFTATAAVTGTSGQDVTVTLAGAPAYTDQAVTAVTSTRSYRVRGVIAGSTITDHYPPFGVPITYQVRVYSSGSWVQADTSPITVPVAVSMLTETAGDTTITVDVVSLTPNQWESQSTTYQVIGRDTPIVAQAPAKLRTGNLKLRSPDQADVLRVRAMLAAGYPIVLRSPYHATVDDLTLLPLTFTESEPVPGSTASLWDIQFQAVSVESTSYGAASANTYAVLLANTVVVPTYTALAAGARWASYAAVAVGG